MPIITGEKNSMGISFSACDSKSGTNILTTLKPLNNGHARGPSFCPLYIGRLSSFGGYFVWSVHRREVCPFSECPLLEGFTVLC